MAINPEELRQASKKASIAGGFCQLSGAMLAVIGGGLTITTVLGGGGLYGLFLGGSATFLLALAGAPVAALGSIANSQKASKEMLCYSSGRALLSRQGGGHQSNRVVMGPRPVSSCSNRGKLRLSMNKPITSKNLNWETSR